jgi:hypothetical protein
MRRSRLYVDIVADVAEAELDEAEFISTLESLSSRAVVKSHT